MSKQKTSRTSKREFSVPSIVQNVVIAEQWRKPTGFGVVSPDAVAVQTGVDYYIKNLSSQGLEKGITFVSQWTSDYRIRERNLRSTMNHWLKKKIKEEIEELSSEKLPENFVSSSKFEKIIESYFVSNETAQQRRPIEAWFQLMLQELPKTPNWSLNPSDCEEMKIKYWKSSLGITNIPKRVLSESGN